MLLASSRHLRRVRRPLSRCSSTSAYLSSQAALAARFSELTDLADDRLGAKVLFATDEWFATADNMLKPSAPHFDPETFCVQGKVMDGWESRRRRLAGHDWSVVKLGLAGYVHGFELDTAHFTGNQVPAASIFAATIDVEDDESWLGPPRPDLGVQGTCTSPEEIEAAKKRVHAAAEWVELLPISKLRAGYTEDGRHGLRDDGLYSVHRFAVPPELARRRVTHLLVNQHPDGGLARMRAWGVVGRDYDAELAGAKVGAIDLLSALNGGRAVGCSNKHYGEPRNLLRPGRGVRMDDGWETARNPKRPHEIVKDETTGLVHMPGAQDWCVLRMAAVAGSVEEVVIDTANFRGNFPESVLVEACDASGAPTSALMGGDGSAAIDWQPLLARTRLGPDAIHTFKASDLVSERASQRTTHGHILSGGGTAEALYTEARGYPFSSDELPHHHLINGSTSTAFQAWSVQASAAKSATAEWMAGAWHRTIFAGGGMQTTDADETCLNLITPHGPFIDIRIPNACGRLLGDRPWDEVAAAVEAGQSERPLASLTDLEVRLLSRQHAFGGVGVLSRYDDPPSPDDACEAVCTRHHAIDWNFVGALRPRPNKWRVKPTNRDDWEELAYADDEQGQPYYYERWVRAAGGGAQPSLALRAVQPSLSGSPSRDALLLVVGGYFSYVVARPIEHSALSSYGKALFAVVDEAILRGDRHIAEQCLLQESGYGRVGGEWTIEASLQPWRIGKPLGSVFGGGSMGGLEAAVASARTPPGKVEQVLVGKQAFEVI